ncbi:hypothetical protein GBAR_LOCUS1563 [Geodia barretti]|uniref:Fibrous sheath-interacting protein 1 n=1 Tax=Geodia barretti TaxID=519541 RepID=A0AA35QX88_GEOBA|nr:hypothetical protein GBAR_LOCUS1563 [Geodia barretti]
MCSWQEREESESSFVKIDMSSSNELEVISRGSIDIPHTQEPSSQQGTLTTDKKTAQNTITLEPLPPERPRYRSHYKPELVGQKGEEEKKEEENKEEEEELSLEVEADTLPLCLERASHQLAQSRLHTDSLLQRIESLSGRIRSGLSLVESTGATVSQLPFTITASDTGGDPHDNVSTGDPEDIERGGERGVDSPEAGEVDPKLAKALEKMKKLDKRLADLVVGEEVKEQRRQLELQMAGVVDPQEPLDLEDGVHPFAPVFQTQLPEGKEPGTDFIQRNIEEAEAAVVLSEPEKLRLEQLLAQDDDNTVEMDDGSTESVNEEANVFKLSAESQTALRHIDIQLEAMGGCGVEEPGLGNYGEQQQSSSAAEDSQRLQEIDEKLAELRKSSTQPQELLALQHLIQSCDH